VHKDLLTDFDGQRMLQIRDKVIAQTEINLSLSAHADAGVTNMPWTVPGLVQMVER
jgi:hypothetical protein